jgi:phosphatidylglycerophosphate synthase
MNLPNILTASRIAMVPLLFATAWRGAPNWFAAFFFWALLSDVLDGPIARLLNQQSPLGGLLDSIADAALFLAICFTKSKRPRTRACDPTLASALFS